MYIGQGPSHNLFRVNLSPKVNAALADEIRMKKQSSLETRSRAKALAESIGSHHTDVNIDDVFNAQKSILTEATGFEPLFLSQGGNVTSNLALQNIQAR